MFLFENNTSYFQWEIRYFYKTLSMSELSMQYMVLYVFWYWDIEYDTKKLKTIIIFLNYAILKFPIQIPHKKLKCTYLYKIISMSEYRM